VLSLASQAPAAEMCATGVAGTGTTCEAAWDLAQAMAQWRRDRSLALSPARDRFSRLNGGAPQIGDGTAPFAVKGDDNNVDFKTSLTQWGSALSAADLAALKEAQSSLGEASLPKPPRTPKPKFDIWAQGHRERLTEAGVKHGDAFTTYVGADYLWSRNLLIGGLMQVDDSRQTVLAAPDASFRHRLHGWTVSRLPAQPASHVRCQGRLGHGA